MPRYCLALAGAFILLLQGAASACPFCNAQGQTLSGEVGQADFIVLGSLSNVKRDPEDPTRGTTDLTIETVVKPHPLLRVQVCELGAEIERAVGMLLRHARAIQSRAP